MIRKEDVEVRMWTEDVAWAEDVKKKKNTAVIFRDEAYLWD